LGGRRESRKEEGDPTRLAPAEVFFTDAVGHQAAAAVRCERKGEAAK
jgi:hypothetical protein